MATSLLKFSFKTNLVKSIISEISSNIGKYYYAFGKSDPWFTVKGLTATIVENSNSVVLTSGTTEGFLVGQLVTQTGGNGLFGSNTSVSAIVSSTEFEVTESHVTSGTVTFSIDDETIVEQASDLFEYETSVRNNMILFKQIDSNDVAPVIPRIDWVQGYVFDMYREYTEDLPAYSGTTSLQAAQFYVITDQFNVYKCLDNNNNAISMYKPTGVSPTPFTLEDGYIWKYMYTVPISLRNKFLTTTLMPVTTALTNQFYAKGSIVGYSIENPGNAYKSASYKVTGFKIISGGVGYTGTPTITIEAPHQSAGTQATVGTVTVEGGKITAVEMTDEGDGYSYPPQFEITGVATIGAILEPIIENTGSSYVNLTVVGDGRLEENPYEIESIEILSGGSGYDSITLLFADPDLPNGVRASATVNLTDGVATSITIDEPGYGYSNPFYSLTDQALAPNIVRIVQTNLDPLEPGSGFFFRVHNKVNPAEIAAVLNLDGQIEQVKVIKPGIGYTFGSVVIEADPDTEFGDPDYSPASILLDFGVGSIETSQSTTEITAIPGAIYAIVVTNPGAGYSVQPYVRIVGDGVGATATVTLTAFNTIEKINITNPGYGYTYASIVLEDDQGIEFADEDIIERAVFDVILPPQGGHGKDAISELYCKSIMFHSVLFKDRMFAKEIGNDFRQVCLVKNPKIYGTDAYLRLGIAPAAQLVIGSNTQTADFNEIAISDILTDANENRFLVTAKYLDYDAQSHALALTNLDNTLVVAGNSIGRTGVNFSVLSVINPQVNKFSGEVLSIDNRIKFSPTAEQIVIASNTITF